MGGARRARVCPRGLELLERGRGPPGSPARSRPRREGRQLGAALESRPRGLSTLTQPRAQESEAVGLWASWQGCE